MEKKNIVLTDAKYRQLFRAVELNIDEEHLREKLLPHGISIDELSQKSVPYFKQYGFRVPQMFSQIYEMHNGIKSDRYIPASLYYYYIAPYLCNLNFMEAYIDKNFYSTLFPDIKQPETIVKCINGRYYNNEFSEIVEEDAIEILGNTDKFIIKPSLETGGGEGVTMVDNHSHSVNITGEGNEYVRNVINKYSQNWIAQKPIISHQEMLRFNPTSVNTLRIYTYRPVNSSNYVVLGSALRFGGKGSAIDNVCMGGGFIGIDQNGDLMDKVNRYFVMPRPIHEFGFGSRHIPFYADAIRMVLNLHWKTQA